MNPRIRPAAVAGTFYPAEPNLLAALVDGLVVAADIAAFSARGSFVNDVGRAAPPLNGLLGIVPGINIA